MLGREKVAMAPQGSLPHRIKVPDEKGREPHYVQNTKMQNLSLYVIEKKWPTKCLIRSWTSPRPMNVI